MKLIWPADSSSPIDLSLFQLLCTSRRLIKINPAAKTRLKCFFLFSFFSSRGSFWLSVKVWRTRPRLGTWENVSEIQARLLVLRERRVGRDMKGRRQTSACRRAEMGLISPLTCGPSAGSDSRARFNGERAQGNLLWFKIDNMPKRRWAPIHQSFPLQLLVTPLSKQGPLTIFFFFYFFSLLFSLVWRSLALGGWSMRLIRPNLSPRPRCQMTCWLPVELCKNTSGASAAGLLFYFLWH